MGLRYTDEVPTVPGWYWCRWNEGPDVRTTIRLLPHMGSWPRSWRQERDQALAVASAELRPQLLALSEDSWKREYAGPIAEPTL